MMKPVLLYSLLLSILFIACQSEPKPPEQHPTKETVETPAKTNSPTIRDTPGMKGKELAQLKNGTKLYDLDKVSDFTNKIKLRGIPYDEPWIKIATEDKLEGWVYAGGLSFENTSDGKSINILMEKRLESFFGKNIKEDILNYQQSYSNISTSKDFQKTLQTGVALRDTIVNILSDKVFIEDVNEFPDVKWLERALPGFSSSLVAEATAYYLFVNYKQWHQKAILTKAEDDDGFVDLCYTVHATDSIEHFFPSWFLQMSDYGGYSLLGQGQHKKIFQKMDRLLSSSHLFKTEIDRIKSNLINDILSPSVEYWETQPKILKELDEILKADFSNLTDEDKIGLKTRRQMFVDFEKNKIELDYRSGTKDMSI